MKIKSSFKDYYDYIAYQYGGGDSRVVYVRSKMTSIDGVSEDDLSYPIESCKNDYYDLSYINNDFNYKWCVVCGIQYLIAAPINLLDKRSEYSIVTDKHPAMKDLNKRKKARFSNYYFGKVGRRVLESHQKSFPYLYDISRILKSPVFIMESENCLINIDNIVPNLKVLGFDKLIESTQMYQNIALWVGNTLKEHPDDEPPKSINNEERIIAHGFDLKNSFRNIK